MASEYVAISGLANAGPNAAPCGTSTWGFAMCLPEWLPLWLLLLGVVISIHPSIPAMIQTPVVETDGIAQVQCFSGPPVLYLPLWGNDPITRSQEETRQYQNSGEKCSSFSYSLPVNFPDCLCL